MRRPCRLSLLAALLGSLLITAMAQAVEPKANTVIEDFFRQKYDQMVQDFRGGRFEKVLRTASAILELYPDFPLADKVKDFKLRAKSSLVGRDYIRGVTRLDRAECAVGDRVTVTFSIRNIHTGRVVIHLGPDKNSPWTRRGLPVASAFFRFTQYGYLGGMRTDAWSQTLQGLTGTLVLEPGETFEKEFILDTAQRSPLKATRRVYEISGLMRPSHIVAGEKTIYRPLTLEPARLTVYPLGYTILKAHPLQAIEEALEREAGINLFLAIHFVGPDAYADVLQRLVRAVDEDYDDPRMRRALFVALRVHTGRPVPRDLGAFRRWWTRHGAEAGKGPRKPGDNMKKDD
jgi:hypothetical protein